ncbi:MAG TPA: invasin domain 3-containing protein, partial [Longimicrobium sp.]|nr:invasin domain 3-containing protein [Longimicrobium sp.]
MAAAAWLAAASALPAQQAGSDPLRGDVDGDGAVTAADARIVADYLVGKPVPAGVDVARRGDVNGDGRVTSVDAAIIRGYVAGRSNVDRFKVGLPGGELPPNAVARIVCVVKARGASVSCGEPASTPDGLRATEMYTGGPNGTYVKLTSSSPPPADAEGNLKFTVTVQNKLGQRIGTLEDGVTPHPEGVRVFFDQVPTATGPVGSGGTQIQVLGGAQPGTFVNGPRPYYGYTAPLDPGETSEAVEWHFKLDPGVIDFNFTVYVWGHGLPGWIDISPPTHDPSAILVPVNYLTPGDSVDVTGTVRNSFGVALGTPVGNWDAGVLPSIVTVASTGSHTARIKAGLTEGVDTVTASSMPPTSTSSTARIGRTAVVVTYGDSALSTITASPTSLAAGGSSTITVQAKFPDGSNVTKGGATVTLTASPGGALAVTDNNNGTYTANLTSNTAGQVTVTGTLNGRNIIDTEIVTFTAAGLDHFLVEAAGGGPIADQLVNSAFNVKVTAQDQFNNTVTGYTGTVKFTTIPVNKVTAGSSTSAAFAAGVLNSHAITIDSAGTYSLVATDNGDNTKSGTSTPPFQVEAPPTAVPDGPPSATSTPGQAYHTAFETTINIPAVSGLLANDTRGFPDANVAFFGADSLTGSVTLHAAESTVSPLPGHTSGSLKVYADGRVDFTPPDDFTGLYVFKYRLSNDRGTSDAQVTIAVGVRPAANTDTYPHTMLGNVPINTANGTPYSVANNDAGDAKRLVLGTVTGGAVELDSLTGTFVFRPTPGHTTDASFTYTLRNGFGTVGPVTVTIPVSGIVWFVNANLAVNGNGRADSAFTTLPSALAVAQANQPIFLFSSATSYTGGTLAANQRLIGQAATTGSFSALMGGVTWPVHALVAEPTVGAPHANPTVVSGLTLASGNTIRGFNLTSGTLSGASIGTLTVSEVGINTTSQALNLSNGTLVGSFTGVTSTSGTNNVSLSTVALSGAVGLGSGALSGATGNALLLSNVTSATASDVLSYGGTIGNTTANAAVQVTNGSPRLSLSGNVSKSGAGAALAVSGGSAIATLSGTLGTSGSGAVVAVSGGHSGTLTLTGSVSVSTGTGLQFDNADGTYDFTGVTGLTLNGGDAAIDVVNGSGGSFSFPLLSQITNPTGEAIRINASSPTFTYLGRVDKTNGGTGITVSNNTSGSISFGSRRKLITSTGSNVAVNLTSNGTATISSADSLQITSATGNGYNATGGGTVTVGGTQNTISSSGGTALNVQNTAIGGGVLNFKSISATGGSGIALNNTSGGGLTVPGDGASDAANTARGRTTAKSGGGTLVLGSGGTISGAS